MTSDLIGHEETGHRGAFFFERGGQRLGEMTYSRVNAALVIVDHTEVDPSLSGQGIGRKLLDAVVAWARASQTKIIATCPYVIAQLAKDPLIRDVVGS